MSKFGASGLTESSIYEDGSGNVGIGTTTPIAPIHLVTSGEENVIFETTETTNGRIGFDLKTNYGASSGDYFRCNFRGDFADVVQTVYDSSTDTYHVFTKFDYSTDLLTLGNLSGYTYILSERTGIGTNTPSEKLEVNGNIKGDTGKFDELYLGAYSIRDTSHIDRANWIEFVGNWSGAGGATNLSTTYASESVTITSDTGTDAVINRATNTTAGIMAAGDKARLETISVFWRWDKSPH